MSDKDQETLENDSEKEASEEFNDIPPEFNSDTGEEASEEVIDHPPAFKSNIVEEASEEVTHNPPSLKSQIVEEAPKAEASLKPASKKRDLLRLFKPQLISLFLEIVKFAIAGMVMTLFLSTQSGQKIATKALPILGFSNSAQVNLALRLLIEEVSEEEFHNILVEVKKKIHFETTSLFSKSSAISPEKRLELLTQLKGYAFSAIGVDLESEIQEKLKEHNQNLEVTTIEALNYMQSLAAAHKNPEREKILRELKILLMNRKYLNLLEKALPYWYQDEAFVLISLLAIIALDQETPELLKKMLSGPIVYQR